MLGWCVPQYQPQAWEAFQCQHLPQPIALSIQHGAPGLTYAEHPDEHSGAAFEYAVGEQFAWELGHHMSRAEGLN